MASPTIPIKCPATVNGYLVSDSLRSVQNVRHWRQSLGSLPVRRNQTVYFGSLKELLRDTILLNTNAPGFES